MPIFNVKLNYSAVGKMNTKDINLFGDRNYGVEIEAENKKDAIEIFNSNLLPGQRYNPFYLTVTELKAKKNPSSSSVKIVHNKLLGGWYIVRGPHHTPIGGRFNSKAEAQAHLAGSARGEIERVESETGRKANPVTGADDYENILRAAYNALHRAINNKADDMSVQARMSYLEGLIDAGANTPGQRDIAKREIAELVGSRVK